MHPIAGKRILITRTRHQASELAAQIEALGATSILIPTIEIVPPASFDSLDDALRQLHTFDWLLFTSTNAVEVFVHRMNGTTYAPRLAAVSPRIAAATPFPRIAVIGPATARAVQSAGFSVDLMPPQFVAESLSAALVPHVGGAKVLFVRAAEARDHLPEALAAAGAHVTVAEAYRNRTPPESIPALQHLFSAPALYPDAITFTSASTARNLAGLLEAARLALPQSILLASIGPITSEALRDLGLTPTVEASAPTISALLESLISGFEDR